MKTGDIYTEGGVFFIIKHYLGKSWRSAHTAREGVRLGSGSEVSVSAIYVRGRTVEANVPPILAIFSGGVVGRGVDKKRREIDEK